MRMSSQQRAAPAGAVFHACGVPAFGGSYAVMTVADGAWLLYKDHRL